MPRRRKSLSLSPQRKALNPTTPATFSSSGTLPPPPPAMSHSKEETLASMCEMFPNLDPSLVEMVLSEYTEVETVMDYLLELSTSAKEEDQLQSTDEMYINGYQANDWNSVDVESSLDQIKYYGDEEETTADLDVLLDEALDKYGLRNSDHIYSTCDGSEASTNGLTSDLIQSTSLENTWSYTPNGEETPVLDYGATCDYSADLTPAAHEEVTETAEYDDCLNIPNDLHDFCVQQTSDSQESAKTSDQQAAQECPESVLAAASDMTTASTTSSSATPSASTTSSSATPSVSATLGTPSTSSSATASASTTSSSATPSVFATLGTPSTSSSATASASTTSSSATLSTPSTSSSATASASTIKWNPMASAFYPSSSSFITPVVANPMRWTNVVRTREAIGVLSSNAHVPSTSVWNHIPQSVWSAENMKPAIVPQPVTPRPKKAVPFAGNVLVLLRGAPGSGKSTLARKLLEQNPTGIILSTDDYFFWKTIYKFDINCLSEAHDWNHKRAEDAFKKNLSPIIIDNTNMQAWEMKPYVSMAMKYKYKVCFREPETWWQYKPKELERRNTHGVTKEKIKRMLDNFERVTVSSILTSKDRKWSKSGSSIQLDEGETNGATNGSSTPKKDTDILTMPDTVSVNPSDADVAAANEQSLVSEVVSGNPEIVLDALKSIKQNQDTAINKSEKCADILQRLEAISIDDGHNDYDNETSDPLEVDADKDDASGVDMLSKLRPELLSFVGDWPIEQTLHQRAPRRKKHKSKNQSVDQPKEEETMDCQLAESAAVAKSIPQDENASSASTILPEDPVANHYDENGLQNQETPSYACPKSVNDDHPYVTVKTNDSAIDTFFKIIQDPNECVSNPDKDLGKADAELTPKSRKSNCRQTKLALTFSNGFSSIPKCNGVLPPTEPVELSEALDRSSRVCRSSQTEPYEFAIAWRAEKKKKSDVSDTLKILTGNSVRFKSKVLQVSDVLQNNIPYRMVHHKSTFVEEDEISSIADEDSLQILCKLFRSLSFDVLKDLFVRCNKNLEWATNLLLDSGEKMYREDECGSESWFECQGEGCEHSKSPCNLEEEDIHQDAGSSKEMSTQLEEQDSSVKMEATNTKDCSVTPPDNYTPVNSVSVPLIVAEELKHGNVLSSSEVSMFSNPSTDSGLHEHDLVTDTVEAHILWSSGLEGGQPNSSDVITNNKLNEKNSKEHITQEIISGAVDESCETGSSGEILKALPSTDNEDSDVQDNIEEKAKPKNNNLSQPKESLNFDYLELSLPPEFAFQLTELFGPVGIDPGNLTIEDCMVPINLKLAEAIHKKWKESIMERRNQEALSYQLLAEVENSPNDHFNLDSLLQEQESRLASSSAFTSHVRKDPFPFMDQWNTQVKKVSLRQIMSEEMALQAHEDSKKSVPSANCAVKMKEKQLLELFPNVEQNLLKDIFKESNYSLEKTEEFMSSLLESDPVQNVVAPGYKQEVIVAADRTKEKKIKADKDILSERYFQDLEFPDYDDFRAEAFLYRKKQQECYRKAAEAHNRGMKQVAAYYAQQGYLYGQKMKEEHLRAAVQIFERSNEYLLPENILDLHGLHVDEAMKHFRQVLVDKAEDYNQNGGKPHLLVITGRGNHSQGGVPRIKPAVIDYLLNHNYSFQEKTSGVLRVRLKKA